MPDHTVVQGDHLSAIAEKYGFRLVSTIWDHPKNAALKAKRKNPNILLPGDVLFIPEIQVKAASGGTTAIHKFKAAKEKLKLKLLLLDVNDKPRGGLECGLTIENAATTEKTGGDGSILKEIPKNAQVGRLVLPGEMEIGLKIGHLDPVEAESGQAARLNNLGYEAGDPAGPDPEQFRSAVEEFQCDKEMPVTGKCDAATQEKLKTVHGC
jgi:hypothetical protein